MTVAEVVLAVVIVAVLHDCYGYFKSILPLSIPIPTPMT